MAVVPDASAEAAADAGADVVTSGNLMGPIVDGA